MGIFTGTVLEAQVSISRLNSLVVEQHGAGDMGECVV